MDEHLYTAMERVEKKRRDRDELYALFMDEDPKELNSICRSLVAELLERYTDSSKRMRCMLKRICDDTNRLAKHGLILFALYQEPWFVEQFVKRRHVDPNKFSRFVHDNLKTSCEQLLGGVHTSMQAFVEDTRWRYCML